MTASGSFADCFADFILTAAFECIADPLALRISGKQSANGRGCVKTQSRPLEIDFRLGELSVDIICLLTGRYPLLSHSPASHVVFEGDFWGESVAEFSHSLGQNQSHLVTSFLEDYSLCLCLRASNHWSIEYLLLSAGASKRKTMSARRVKVCPSILKRGCCKA